MKTKDEMVLKKIAQQAARPKSVPFYINMTVSEQLVC